MAACRTLLDDPTLMYFILWIIEVLITTWVIQYTWNFVLVGDKNPDGAALAAGSVNRISFWDAFLLSLTAKLMIFGFSGFMMNV